ncbi:hypothetical protein BRAO375_2810002 [Bradyrhizobium sp. ORS 375]|uniref:hypothetical protein n=1 Tax=Bradyrhizobium sp. (strain ORS 375) TaxID=566679 RepID=UPI00024085CE|nr:hypothetical protein [Bradyrhizobium sp. ORS 375]CCD93802.1 hypothetical protein BRAO375_2810002 [Bradyrhizobium sp. ORS 375]
MVELVAGLTQMIGDENETGEIDALRSAHDGTYQFVGAAILFPPRVRSVRIEDRARPRPRATAQTGDLA